MPYLVKRPAILTPLPEGLDLDALRLRIEQLAACRGSVLATSPDTPRASLVWLF